MSVQVIGTPSLAKTAPPSSTSRTPRPTTFWRRSPNCDRCCRVGGEGVGLLLHGGAPLSTLVKVTHSECGSNVYRLRGHVRSGLLIMRELPCCGSRAQLWRSRWAGPELSGRTRRWPTGPSARRPTVPGQPPRLPPPSAPGLPARCTTLHRSACCGCQAPLYAGCDRFRWV